MSLTFQIATTEDIEWIGSRDVELDRVMLLNKIESGEVVLAVLNGQRIGFLRWSYFWDTIPFMNMLMLDKATRGSGYGTQLVAHWEKLMSNMGVDRVMTSTQSDESAQHFYRKLGYKDTGSLLLPGEALEIIFIKELS